MKLRFSIRSFILLALLMVVALVGVWWLPKSYRLPILPNRYTGYYRGFGLTSTPGIFGKNFYRISVDDGDYGYCEVDYEGPGYNSYRGSYPNGACREEGMCFVELNRKAQAPVPDLHNVRFVKCYKPNGTLGSEVVDGTGTQTFWYPDGTTRWELVLENYSRIRLRTWYTNGQLKRDKHFVDGQAHGEVKMFHENGKIRVQGEFANGKSVGVWRFYDDVGNVTAINDFTVSPMKVTVPSREEGDSDANTNSPTAR